MYIFLPSEILAAKLVKTCLYYGSGINSDLPEQVTDFQVDINPASVQGMF